MVRGNATQSKVHYKGKNDDFIVFVESAQAVSEWKKDKSVPLAQVVNGWKVFVTHKYVSLHTILYVGGNGRTGPDIDNRHGSQGVMDTASHGTLDAEFGTHKEEDVVQQILEKGNVQNHEVWHCPSFTMVNLLTIAQEGGRIGDRNITQGGTVAH